jgi:hypothetical protein
MVLASIGSLIAGIPDPLNLVRLLRMSLLAALTALAGICSKTLDQARL